jgi:DHA2 family multidrug resistance protein
MLDMGQYWGWLTSRHFLLWCAGFIISFGGFLAWSTLAKAPVINLRALRHRNSALGLLVKIFFSINLTVLVGLLATYMVDLRGYQWWQAAVVVLAAAAAMVVGALVGFVFGTPHNRKLRMFVGLAIMIGATTQLMAVDFFSSKLWQAGVLALWGLGAGLVIEPALTTIFEGRSLAETMPLAGAFNILRAVPAYVGLVTLATFWVQDTDAYFDLMRQTMQTNTPIVEQARQTSRTRFVTFGSPHARAEKQSQALLDKWTQGNARAFALQVVFRDLAWLTVPGLLLVVLVRRRSSA